MSRTAIIDDSDPSILYGGAWTANTSPLNTRSPEFMSTYHESHELGATITYTFTGTKITVWSSFNNPSDIPGATAKIDSGTTVRFNSTGDVPNALSATGSSISHIPFYTSPILSEGQHTIVITIDDVSSNGPLFYFDFFTVETSMPQTSPNVIVDDGDTTKIQYGPAWVMSGSYYEYSGTTHQTPGVINGTAVFKFQGTSVSAYGTLNGQYGDGPFATFALDDRPVVLYSAPSITSLAYHQQLYLAEGLADNVEHKLTITAIVKQNILPAWFLDYLVYTPTTAAITGTAGTSPGVVPGTGGSRRQYQVRSPSFLLLIHRYDTDFLPLLTGSTPIVTTVNGVATTLPPNAQQTGPATGPSSNSSSPPIGTIIGVVIGVIGALSLLLFFLFWRRRQRRRDGRVSVSDGGEKSTQVDPSTVYPLSTMSGSGSGSGGGGGNGSSPFPIPAQDTAAYRIVPAPVKSRFQRLGNLQHARHQRQASGSTNPSDGLLSPSAVSSSLPALSRSDGTSETPDIQEEEEEGTSPRRAHRGQGMAVTTLAAGRRKDGEEPAPSGGAAAAAVGAGVTRRVSGPRDRDKSPAGPSNSATATGETTVVATVRASGVDSSLARPGPVQEIDAGVRLDSAWDLEEDELPDTLPPSYSRFR